MSPFVGIERRDSNESMDSTLSIQVAKGVFARDQQGRRLNSHFFARLNINRLRFETVTLDPALVHSQKHIGPITRFGTTGARVNGEKGVSEIVFAGKKLAQLEVG